MKPNEPSRTALMIARQRAAHQVLDHGSILYDPFAMKILREDEKDVLQFANGHPSASIGRLITDRAKPDCGRRFVKSCRKRGSADRHPWRGTRHVRSPESPWRTTDPYFISGPPRGAGMETERSPKPNRTSAMAYSRPVDFERDDVGDKLLASGLSAELARVFHLARGCALSDTGRYRPHSGLHVVHPELGGGVRLHGTSRRRSPKR